MCEIYPTLSDVRRKRVASFEEPVRKLGNRRGFIDLFWKGVLLVEQKSAGQDLVRAKEQALDYFPGLSEAELPRYILTSDFQQFELCDLIEGTSVHFPLSDLPRQVEHFAFIRGVQQRTFRDQDPVNLDAARQMGLLHDALRRSGYDGHQLEQLLVRLLFCLFADDTGIFQPRDIFEDLIATRTNADGSDTGQWLNHLFEILNQKESLRQRNLDEDLAQFPWVNGGLFDEILPTPSFDSAMRRQLLELCSGFSWDAISPAIFGSLFQSVMEEKKGARRAQGAHYTTERNILKVIEPLFLDDLRAEFAQLKARKDGGRTRALQNFHARLGKLRFFDPACGCGNFLIITYRELRALEIELLKELKTTGQLELDVTKLSRINVDQFYGMEISEFPVRVAEVALWMMDHIMNGRLSLAFGDNYARIPLVTSPHIVHADALETDWETVLPPRDCSYVLGNPPFIGAKMQTEHQRAQVRRIARLGGSGGSLDYVTAWFLKAGEYLAGSSAHVGFVATNSLTQGEQVAQLWPLLFQRYGLEISFAHRTFAWGSDARGMAHVHVVIIGLARAEDAPAQKRLFSYDDIQGDPVETSHAALTPYLFDASNLADPHLVVREQPRPVNGLPQLIIGSKPIDGGNYIFERAERDEFLRESPAATEYMRPFVGAEEFINGGDRWILYLGEAPPAVLRDRHVKKRMEAVRQLRFDSKSAPTQGLADYPTRFHVTVVPERPFLVIPSVSSEHREYVPIGWLGPPIIPSNLVLVVRDAEPWQFAILTSRMHMAWLRHIGGRLKSDYRYSAGIVYNTFPLPAISDEQKLRLRRLAQAVLEARARFPNASLADLYDSVAMKPELRKAHRDLDEAVDKLYRRAAFNTDRERVEHLFALYERAVSPLMPMARVLRRHMPRL